MNIKLGFISDLHTKHYEWFDNLQYNKWGYQYEQEWNDLDILIFAGDCSSIGNYDEILNFTEWFSKQPATYKIMIAGNHDFGFENIAKYDISRLSKLIPENIIYLNDSKTEILGLKIWGSPIQPRFHNWAFNRDRGQDIKKHWDMIPNDTDILITHGPPKGILDRIHPKFERVNDDPNVGCIDLLDAIHRIKPKINVFGHIHEGYGKQDIDDIIYINASCLDENYKPVNPPIILNLEV